MGTFFSPNWYVWIRRSISIPMYSNNSNTGFEGDIKTDASEMSVTTREVRRPITYSEVQKSFLPSATGISVARTEFSSISDRSRSV